MQAIGRALAVGILAASAATGAQAPQIKLRPPDVVLEEELNRVASVRELRDGRVIAADPGDRRVVLIDWRSKRVRQIGRTGEGPGEYQSPHDVYSLRADSTLLTDRQSRRWFIIHDSLIRETITADKPLNRLLGPILRGADARGRVLGLRGYASDTTQAATRMRLTSMPEDADSLLVLVADRASERMDTVARIRAGYRGPRNNVRKKVGDNTIVYVIDNPLMTYEQAMLFPDGWIALALLEPYRVDWIAPNGKRMAGAPLPFTRAELGDAERRAAIKQQYGSCLRCPEFTPDDMRNWPQVVPPFLRQALLAAPDGRLVILRAPTRALPAPRYDVVDRRGQIVGTLELPANAKLVGFGSKSAYVAVTDDDGIQRLQRHPWP